MTVNRRPEKIAQELKRTISNYLQTQWSERPKDVLLSVVRAEVSPDLSYATIHIGIFPQKQEQSILELLIKNTQEIQRYISQTMRVRQTPRLSFLLDRGEEQRALIDTLLEEDNH